ncbi:hypothetical protein [Rhizohabitans arisaemae]|uniref:hypothetical protein n=1 Tax=Rhizohabitans arisaemae TaxID=2720610 RepID=UPI0024B1882F|nr:hypothetical protein [Rhizohabitans arisaemae]
MLHIELDVFSGRPNPYWKLTAREERELIDRLTASPAALRPVDQVESKLGYRGMVVHADRAGRERLTAAGLPPGFRLREATGVNVSDVAERWLLHTPGAQEALLPEVGDVSDRSIGSPSAGPGGQAGKGLLACAYWASWWADLNTFWNGTRRSSNNCYNFASSLATGTFAQPGRGSGSTFSSLTVANIEAATFRDGYTSFCNDDRFISYLCIWPGVDFHFYHLIHDLWGTSNRWAHKPGSTPATNLDNSGNPITNPVTCNRGPYTVGGTPWIYPRVNPRSNIR